MIRVISTKEGYVKGGIAWSCLPTYCEEGFLSAAQIETLKAAQITPDSPNKRIIVDLNMPEPEGEGWTIHRMSAETRAKAEKAGSSAPVSASAACEENRERLKAAKAAAADEAPARKPGRPAKNAEARA